VFAVLTSLEEQLNMDYEKCIGVVPDFPKKGISFKDISPLLGDPKAFHSCIDDLAKLAEPYKPDMIIAAESRGFIFGSALAYKLGIGFVMARKPHKLPGHNLAVSYTLEYGQETLEIRDNAFKKGQRVLLVDDLIATGGSLNAMATLARKCGATPVAALCVISLKELKGASTLDIPFDSLVDLSANH
jgi:adenine phosphoribosyltransferase